MTDMSLAAALNETKKLTNLFKGLSKLEDVLGAAERAESSTQALQKKKAALEVEISGMTERLSDLQKRTETEKNSSRDGLEAVKKKIAAEVSVANKRAADNKKKHEEAEAAAIAETAKREQGAATRIAVLRSEEEALKRTLINLERSIDSLRAKVDKVLA